ncbi:imidazolonepropionase [Occallatibacter riparius]|uniref:Imidazolonepropionase n=1 Tax=Occallatibacter riparius TaxID=1002689 RepID=A0A9J7BHC3_9BACT|nr:imidazolonepropionase [Occallatibacter riparius]UWZ82192.1 imidazolonepropionase [Occallatibacter riparius]
MIKAIVNIGQLVTLAGPARPRVGAELHEVGIRENAALLLEHGRIAAVGSSDEIRSKVPLHEVLDAQGRCVTPGFVDAHTHLVFAGNRADEYEKRIAGATYQEIAAAGGGILRTVRLTREASEDELLASTRRHRDWMLRGGTTTIEAKSGYGLDHDTELKMLRVIARLNEEGPAHLIPTLLSAHTVPPEFIDRRAEYIRWVAEDLIPKVAAAGLARYCDAFCDDHAFTVDETRVVLESAKRHGLGLRIHAEQFRPGTGAALAAELGAATADHLETVMDETLAQLRQAGVQPVLLPGSVFALSRTQYPPARKMVEAGLAIVLATDFNPGSSPVPSMPFMLSLACLQMRLTPAEALTAATINAAHTLGLGAEIGSLEKGKRADFLIHEFTDYRELAYFIAAPARPRVFIGGAEVAT